LKARKPKTQGQQDRATDLRLRRTYGIGLDEYNIILDQQGGVCAICFEPPRNRRLHTDHCHRFVRQKITTYKFQGQWIAEVSGTPIQSMDLKKSAAVASVRHKLKGNSVRGLLCWGCNAALQKFSDDPERMENAARYIRRFNTQCQLFSKLTND